MASTYKSFSVGTVLREVGEQSLIYTVPSNARAKLTFLSISSTTINYGFFGIKKASSNIIVRFPPLHVMSVATSSSGVNAVDASKLGIYLDTGDEIYAICNRAEELSFFASGILEYSN